MKTFEDLDFEPHPMGGVMAKLEFENSYGVSVVRTQYTYGGSSGLYELAVLDESGSLTYDTPVTNDVLGWLTESDVTEVMRKVQQLEE